MIWTELTKTAYDITCKTHRGQSDRGGNPYIIHPCTLAAQMPDEETTTIALLHDILEDSDITPENLAEYGIPDHIIKTVILLSRNHWPNLSYMEYIQNLQQSQTAITVKTADLLHNLDLSRLNHEPTKQDQSLHRRYQKALAILQPNTQLPE